MKQQKVVISRINFGNFLSPVEIFGKLVATELKKILSYRIDFWMSSIAYLVVRFVVMYFVFKSIFAEKEDLNGFTFASINLFVFLASICRKFTMGEASGILNEDIYSGNINKYLVLPMNLFLYKFSEHVAGALVAFVQLFLGLALYSSVFGFLPFAHISAANIALCFAAVCLGCLIYFFLALTLDAAAYFTDGVWSLHVSARQFVEFLGGGAIPLALFSESVRDILSKLPFYYIGAFPIECLLGRLSNSQIQSGIFYAVVWLIVMYGLAKFAHFKGLKNYTGVGM